MDMSIKRGLLILAMIAVTCIGFLILYEDAKDLWDHNQGIVARISVTDQDVLVRRTSDGFLDLTCTQDTAFVYRENDDGVRIACGGRGAASVE